MSHDALDVYAEELAEYTTEALERVAADTRYPKAQALARRELRFRESEVRPDGPETAYGGLIGQGGY